MIQSLKKNILIVGSESALAKPVIDEICERNDEITTISRRKNSLHKNHFCVDLSDTKKVIEARTGATSKATIVNIQL